MDQLKDVLKQLIKYRFWIAVGISAILPMVAYILGAGPIQEKTAVEEGNIQKAADGVKKYMSGTPVNVSYAPLVQGKTEELTKEVDVSWKKLYERQSPLLTWPERVQQRFTTWGRKWPKDVDPSAVQFAILDYINEYPKFVTEVYKSFRPFDYVEGTGVVAAPPEQALLKPSQAMVETSPPSLGKVWSAQERLWIQRTMLDVVATVNKEAKDWDTGIIKQIMALEVGNKAAQDQRSIAKGEALVEAADVTDPNAPPPPTSTTAAATTSASTPGAAPGAGGETTENPESVYYIGSPDGAFKILPVMIAVLIDQDHIQDFLVALENSPMTIQVRDFEMFKPLSRVEKPKKGVAPAYGGMGMPGSSFMMPSNAMPMTGYGPAASMPTSMSNANYAPGGAPGGSGASGGMGAPAPVRKGVNVRDIDRLAAKKKQEESALNSTGVSLHDPYYNIVEVKIYGQARFFNHPPVAPAAEPSQAAAAPAATPAPADGATPTPAPAPAAATTPAPAEKKAEEPKAEDKKAAGEPEKKSEEPKAEEKKAEPAKADAEKKAEPAAPEPKAEPAKADAEKKAEPAAPKN